MTIRNTLPLGVLSVWMACATAVPVMAHAAGEPMQNHSAHAPAAPSATAAADFTEGEMRKVNKSTGKLTIKHGEIKNIQMPPMTMVFEVADKAMLDSVKEGDKVKFKAKQDGSKLIVTDIQR